MPIKDDSLVSQYIRSIENPDSIGYRNGRWYAPDNSIYDKNNRGFGMDVNYNTATVDLTKDRPGKYLTEEEERELRLQHIQESKRILDKWTPQILRNMPSEEKRAMAVGMIYRGDGIKNIVKNPTINKAYLYGSNDDMQKAVSDYYQSKKVSERAQRHNQFFNPQKKNVSPNNVSSSIRRPTPYTPPKFSNEQFIPGKKYDEGGSLINDWDSLSNRDKAEMMKVAIDNGITTLPEIRNAYNEFAKGGRMKWTMEDEADYRSWKSRLPRNRRNTNDNDYDMRAAYRAGMEPMWNEEDRSYHLGSRDPQSGRILKAPHHPTFLKALLEDASLGYYPRTDNEGHTYTDTWKGNNMYAGGGYRPSGRLQKDIATWEGSEMKRNRPFSEMTQQFNAVVPKEVQSRLSSNQLDALYSYGYNVGMGKLKERVMPTLNAFVNGKATNEDVQKSMWATKDSQLRGLARRRSWERDMFGGNYRLPFSKETEKNANLPVNLGFSQSFHGGIDNSIAFPQMQLSINDVDPSTVYKAPTIDDTLFANPHPVGEEVVYDPRQERLDNLNRFNVIMGMLGETTPFSGLMDSEPGIMSYVNAIYGL